MEEEVVAQRLALARLVEGQLALGRELAELRATHARELAELRAEHARALAAIEEELRRHREAEAGQGAVVAQYAASLEADRKALAELRAVKAEGKAGVLGLLADQRVIAAIISILLAVAGVTTYYAGAANGAAAAPHP